MRILAIDPGYTQSAFCETLDGMPCWSGMSDNAAVRALLIDVFGRPSVHRPDHLAIEMVASYGMAVGVEVFETVRWIGRFQEAYESRGGAVRLIFRKDVKLHLCGDTRAKDSNIRQAIIDRFGPGKDKAIGRKAAPGPLYGIKADVWSALAVAITAESARGAHA